MGPLLNSGEVWLDTFAVSKISWKSLHEFSEVSNGIQDVREVSVEDIVNNILDDWLSSGCIIQANLNVLEVISLDKSINESSNNSNSILNWNWDWWEW